MLPSKLISPTFVVIGAIVGGVTLSLSQCQAAGIDHFDDQPSAPLPKPASPHLNPSPPPPKLP